ncbi:MAG: PTS cellobiose transporter subunit IIB [Nitrospirales bacterium]|nr:MAG: PTS cellobiose transporter subunit IIB [Nitrospirales bacterium]
MSHWQNISMKILWLFTALLFIGCSEPTNSDISSDIVTADHERTPAPATTSEASIHLDDVSPKAKEHIRTEEAIERLTPHVVTAPGNVTLDLNLVAKVASLIPGQVEKLTGKLGQHVLKGQPLVAIESLILDELVQDYLVAKAKRDVSKKNFTRTKQLVKEHIVSQRRVLEDHGTAIETQAVFQHVREKLLNMGLTHKELHELEHGSHLEGHQYILRAPLDGTITHQQVVLGQGVSVGEELFEIVDTSRVWVFANLPIEQARRFSEGDQGTVVPRGGQPITAQLAYISPVAEEATRTVRVRFDVDNQQGRLKPNEYVDVQLLDEQLPVLSIPATAVTMVNGKRGVFVQRETGYNFVLIELGQEGGGLVEITQGIQLGDKVVTQGVFDLKNALLQGSIEGH